MPEPKPSLHRKLAQVLLEVGRIPKNGKAPAQMGGYSFVQVGDAADAIREALAEKLLTMHPTRVSVVGQVDRPTKTGGNMTTVDLLVEWTITDAETGESIVIMSFGAGADGGDKYSGKAMTSAMKYAFLSGFLLSTGDDTEASNLPEQRGRGSQQDEDAEAPAASSEPYRETVELLGDYSGTGMVRVGTADGYKLEAREGPNGHVIGFRMEFRGEKAIPQVIVEGPAGEALFLACGMNPGQLRDTRLRVKGRLSTVRSNRPRSQSWQRLVVLEWQNADYIYPPEDVDEKLPEPPADLPLPFEQSA